LRHRSDDSADVSGRVRDMSRRLVLPGLLAVAAVAVACGEDDAASLPSVPASAVPPGEPTVGAEAPVTVAGEDCLRADQVTLVFVDGQAEVDDVGGERRLEVRSMTDDGGAGLASVPLDAPIATPILGHHVDPSEWAQEPPEGCEGPYFVVTSLDIAPG
jgi:hypothetical protein